MKFIIFQEFKNGATRVVNIDQIVEIYCIENSIISKYEVHLTNNESFHISKETYYSTLKELGFKLS